MDEIGGEDHEAGELEELALPILECGGQKGVPAFGAEESRRTLPVQGRLVHHLSVLEVRLADQRQKE